MQLHIINGPNLNLIGQREKNIYGIISFEDFIDKLRQQYNDSHLAQHDLLECLAETIWQAQRNNQPLDSETYLNLLKQKSGQP